jgi:uncharacterized damage-inducible protein DinB
MSDLLCHFRLLARYNRLANERLYTAAATLDDPARKLDRKGFFKSIHGTLNHILVGDRIWLGRFEGHAMPSTNLDRILYAEFEALWTARRAEDARIEAIMAGLTGDSLAGSFRYVNNEDRAVEDPAPLIFAHFFNHQTHHRGQVHDMLSQVGGPTPVLDMHRVIRP